MTNPQALSVRKTRNQWIAGSLALVLGSTGAFIFFSKKDHPATLYHHPDGSFSLNNKNGSRITPKDFGYYISQFESFDRIRLVCTPSTKVVDWYPFLTRANWAGASSYQIEAGDKTLSFTLGDENEFNKPSKAREIIDLRNSTAPASNDLPKAEVIILVKSSTLCVQPISEAWTIAKVGKSAAIVADFDESYHEKNYGEPAWWVHSKDEDRTNNQRFKRRRSEFWKKYISPITDVLSRS